MQLCSTRILDQLHGVELGHTDLSGWFGGCREDAGPIEARVGCQAGRVGIIPPISSGCGGIHYLHDMELFAVSHHILQIDATRRETTEFFEVQFWILYDQYPWLEFTHGHRQ